MSPVGDKLEQESSQRSLGGGGDKLELPGQAIESLGGEKLEHFLHSHKVSMWRQVGAEEFSMSSVGDKVEQKSFQCSLGGDKLELPDMPSLSAKEEQLLHSQSNQNRQ